MNEEANLLWQQAVTMYREKKYVDALSILENLEKLAPQDKNILFHKTLCLAALHRFDEAQALCLQLKGQFSDSRVEELEQWINRNVQPYHTRRFEELKAETLPSQAQAQTSSTGTVTPIQPIGESLKAAVLGKMFCPQCGYENDTNNFKCSRCGALLHPSGPSSAETIATSPFAPAPPSDLLAGLEKRANLSFIFALVGWLTGLLIFAVAGIMGPQTPKEAETNVLLVFIIIAIFIVSFILCVLAIIFGIMGMKKHNTVNRWKAIVGLIMGILAVCSMACCFVVVFLFAAVQLGGGNLESLRK